MNVISLLLLAVQLMSVGDLLLVRHVTCPEHGGIIHEGRAREASHGQREAGKIALGRRSVDSAAPWADIEETYVDTRQLPFGFPLRIGKFLSAFGRLDGMHKHYWDFYDSPLVYDVQDGSIYGHVLGSRDLRLSGDGTAARPALMGGKDVGHDNFVLRVLAVKRSGGKHDALEGQARLGDARGADGITIFEMQASIMPTSGRQQIDGEVRTDEIRGAWRDEQS